MADVDQARAEALAKKEVALELALRNEVRRNPGGSGGAEASQRKARTVEVLESDLKFVTEQLDQMQSDDRLACAECGAEVVAGYNDGQAVLLEPAPRVHRCEVVE